MRFFTLKPAWQYRKGDSFSPVACAPVIFKKVYLGKLGNTQHIVLMGKYAELANLRAFEKMPAARIA